VVFEVEGAVATSLVTHR